MFRRGKKTRYIRVILKAGAWKRVPMKLLKWGRKMPSTTQYDLVPNDEYDTRIPLHSDEAFQYGITFHAKYIGTMDVPRPTSRVEIVAAMRRVRYEFKARGVKKRKVTVDVSIDGVHVTTRTKNIKKKKSTKFFSRNKNTTKECIEIMHHPIYRIFYVSHDSSDLKIFSYIARDGATNAFKCNVFKSTKKSEAMQIVRTVGQAFEVCHKMQTNTPDNPAPSTSSAPDDIRVVPTKAPKEPASECAASESGAPSTSKSGEETAPNRPKRLDLLPPPPRKEGKRSQRTVVPSINLPDLPECVTEVKAESATPSEEVATPHSVQHELKLSRQQLEQQKQQTRAAVAQISLLRDQLAAEQTARAEAQARTHQLLVHNKELLDHIAALVAHLQEKEKGISRPISAQQLTQLPQTNTGGNEAVKSENASVRNGNCQPFNTDDLINFVAKNSQETQNVENNNVNLTSFCLSPPPQTNRPSSTPSFGNMSNEQIQNYLISKVQELEVTNGETKTNNNKQFYQNCNAFPHIPPLSNHFSNSDLASLLNEQMAQYNEKLSSSDEFGALAQAMSIGHSQNSLYSTSQATTSKDSSPDGLSSDDSLPFIMPLSHNGTLTATGNDGRVRLIVPISPSGSTSEVGESSKVEVDGKSTSGMTLKVPGAESLAPATPITRSTSEKVPNRSEMMTALRSQWTRHTTK